MRSQTMRPMKTFSQILTETPNLYEGLNLDDATIELLYDFFQFRYVCDDAKFYSYYRRNIRLYQGQYLKQLRLETADIDWFVLDYSEQQTKTQGLNSEDIKRSSNSTNTTAGNNTITSNDTNKSLNADLPNVINYTGMEAGAPDTLDWSSPTSQNETNTAGSSDTNYSSTVTSDGVEKATNQRRNEGITSTISTGRSGASPSDIINRSIEVIQDTNSFKWLLYKLEICFWPLVEKEDLYGI